MPRDVDGQFHKTVTSSGLRIITERHDDVESATVGVWVMAGSVYESQEELGIAHALEHLVFKGTRKRNVRQIAQLVDRMGGAMNACTDVEFVCYSTKVLAESLPLALEVMCEFLTEPLLTADDLDLEKRVIQEEIRGVQDNPEELIDEVFCSSIWEGSRWGRSTLGNNVSVSHLSVAGVRKFLRTYYVPSRVVVAAVGKVDHDIVVRLADKLLGDLPPAPEPGLRLPPRPRVRPHHVVLSREIEQAYLYCGTQAYSATDSRRHAAFLLDSVLTGGCSSRLFQEIREKRGLCYSVGGWCKQIGVAGFWTVATNVAPLQAPKVMSLISRELRKVRDEGVRAAELKRAKQMARAATLMADESSSRQMTRIAVCELYDGRQKSTREMLADMEGVTLDEVHQIAREIFVPETMNVVAVGPLDEPDALRVQLT